MESEKVGLKLNIQKMKIMASGPTISWEIDGETVETNKKKETVETVSDFIFWGSKMTADGWASWQPKRKRKQIEYAIHSVFKTEKKKKDSLVKSSFAFSGT